jgi:hypothetical protein
MVVSNALCELLISKKRRHIADIERSSGKSIEIRVGSEFPAGRIDFYAYDANRTDLDLAVLAQTFPAQLERSITDDSDTDDELLDDEIEFADEDESVDVAARDKPAESERPGGRRRSRRRHRRAGSEDSAHVAAAVPNSPAQSPQPSSTPAAQEDKPAKKSRRRRSKKKAAAAAPESDTKQSTMSLPDNQAEPSIIKKTKSRRRRSSGKESNTDVGDKLEVSAARQSPASTEEPAQAKTGKRRRRKRSRAKSDSVQQSTSTGTPTPTPATTSKPATTVDPAQNGTAEAPAKKRSRRRRRRTGAQADTRTADIGEKDRQSAPAASGQAIAKPSATISTSDQPAKPRRTLYGNRRKLTPAELALAQARNED